MASDLRFAMEDLVADFSERRSEDLAKAQIQITYGSSGNFYAQIAQRAPFDMFFSADVLYPRKLAEQGLALEKSLFEYAIGRIVIWAPKDSPIAVEELQWEALKAARARRIAIANPDHAPYGQAAVAAMKTAGVYEELEKKLVFGENIAQAAQFIDSGAAEIGIIALALAVAPAMADKGRYWEIPVEAFPTMVQGAMITKWTKHPELAREFRAYMLSEHGRTILKRYGFYLPEGKP